MADWQRKLMLNPEWDQCKDDEITLQECAHSILAKLRALVPFVDDLAHIETERQNLIEAFAELAEDPEIDHRDFNAVMRDLYDWVDISLDGHFGGKKVCWVDTISMPETAPT